MSEDRIRVLRILEYEGPRSKVELEIRLRGVKGESTWTNIHGNHAADQVFIREAIIGEVPVILSSGSTDKGDLSDPINPAALRGEESK